MKTSPVGDYLYRAHEDTEAHFDPETESFYGHRTEIVMERFRVIKKTPKGTWIRVPGRWEKRFVLDTGTKRYALPTEEDALRSFLERKRHHLRHLNRQLKRVEEAVIIAKRKLGIDVGPSVVFGSIRKNWPSVDENQKGMWG